MKPTLYLYADFCDFECSCLRNKFPAVKCWVIRYFTVIFLPPPSYLENLFKDEFISLYRILLLHLKSAFSLGFFAATPYPGGFKCFTCEKAADNYECNRWAPDIYCPRGKVSVDRLCPQSCLRVSSPEDQVHACTHSCPSRLRLLTDLLDIGLIHPQRLSDTKGPRRSLPFSWSFLGAPREVTETSSPLGPAKCGTVENGQLVCHSLKPSFIVTSFMWRMNRCSCKDFIYFLSCHSLTFWDCKSWHSKCHRCINKNLEPFRLLRSFSRTRWTAIEAWNFDQNAHLKKKTRPIYISFPSKWKRYFYLAARSWLIGCFILEESWLVEWVGGGIWGTPLTVVLAVSAFHCWFHSDMLKWWTQ